MKRQARGSTDSSRSYDRIINFTSQASDGSSQDLAAEEKASLTFLEETIESIIAEDQILSSDDAQSSGNTISKNRVTCSHRSSCNSPPVTVSSKDLSAEEKACLRFLEDTIDSIEDGGPSSDDAESLPESRNPIGKKHPPNRIKSYLVPTPLVLATSKEITFPKKKTLFNKDNIPLNDLPSSDDASHWGPLSYDDLRSKTISMYSENPPNCSENKRIPPPVAPKPMKIPSYILNPKGSTISNPASDQHSLSTSPQNCGSMRRDKAKLEALSKLGLHKDDVTNQENKQSLDTSLSSSLPDWPQKDQGGKSGMNLESSVSNAEELAIQKLSRSLSLSLGSDVDDDQRWARRKLGYPKD